MKKYYKKDLPYIIEACQDYIDQCANQEQQQYQDELYSCCGDFLRLTESGIFHDAIGKVVNRTQFAVEVASEY